MKILVSNTYEFEKEITRLNKKAIRIGVPLITFTNLGRVTKSRTIVTSYEGESSERTVPVDCTEYELILPIVEDREWTLAATVTPMEGEAQRSFLDKHIKNVDLSAFENADPCRCDHCHTNRHRSLTYIVQNKATSELRQLGRNCFADYIGTAKLAQLEFCAFLAVQFGDNDGEFFPRGHGAEDVKAVRHILCVAEAFAVLSGGWRNNAYDEEGHVTSSGTHRIAADYLKRGLLPIHCAIPVKDLSEKAASEEIKASVEKAIDEIRNLDIPEDDDFGHTLQYCASFEFVPTKKASTVAYTCQYLRNRAYRAEQAAKQAKMHHVGTVGKREVFVLTCRKVVSYNGFYGTNFIHIFEDANGNELVWKTGDSVVNEGETVTLKATVKEHANYRGAPQTILSRAKVS